MHSPVHDVSAVTLAVIAGGLGRRMGVPKAWLRVGDESILAWIHRRFNWPGPTMLVTAPATANPPGAEIFDQHCLDPVSDAGPLRGILTALENASTPMIIAVTVDMPAIDRHQLVWLTTILDANPESQGVMCCVNRNKQHQIEPFPSIFRADAGKLIAERLELGRRSVQGLCEDPKFLAALVPPDWPDDVWTNLNDPAQFATFEAHLNQQPTGE